MTAISFVIFLLQTKTCRMSDALTERWYGVVANEILRLPYGQSNETEIEKKNLVLEEMAMTDQPPKPFLILPTVPLCCRFAL